MHSAPLSPLTNMNEHQSPALTFTQLSEQRRRTDAIARLLRDQLNRHLETLRPVLAPERVLGKLTGAKTEAAGAERALVELREKYRDFTTPPYNLAPEF